MTCCNCPYTDGLVYTSLPPKVKCSITGEFHEYAFECNCEAARQVKENIEKFEAKVSTAGPDAEYVSLNPLNKDNTCSTMLQALEQSPIISMGTATAVAAEIGTPCLICGESIPTGYFSGPKICRDCKKAVAYIKNRFKEEINDYREEDCSNN